MQVSEGSDLLCCALHPSQMSRAMNYPEVRHTLLTYSVAHKRALINSGYLCPSYGMKNAGDPNDV